MLPPLVATVSLNSGPFMANLNAIQRATANVTSGMAYGFGGAAGEIMTTVRAFGVLGGAAYEAGKALRSTISSGVDYQQQMANVGSVTGMTKKELLDLGASAAPVAAKLGFMASQSGTAMYALGSAGLSTGKQIKDVLVPALMLSGATQSESGIATESLTATLKAFQMAASGATHIANLFSGAIASSPATMERLSNAMVFAAPAAASLGYSLEDTVGQIAALHQVGLMGEKAGTAFRNMLLELVEAAGKADTAIGQALKGWKVGSEGLTGAIDRLNAAGISSEDVMQEFGKRAGPAMALMMKVGSAAVRDLTDKIVEQGNVQKMYMAQMDTVKGQWKIFAALMDQVKQQAFVGMAPAIQQVIVKMQSMVHILPAMGAAVVSVGQDYGRLALEIAAFAMAIKAGGKLIAGITATTAALQKFGWQLHFLQRDFKLASSGFIPKASGAFSVLGMQVSKTAASFGILGAAFAGMKLGQWARKIESVAKVSDQIATGFLQLTGRFTGLDNSTLKSTESLRKQRQAMQHLWQETEKVAEAVNVVQRKQLDWDKVAKALNLHIDVMADSSQELDNKLSKLEEVIGLAGDGTGEMSEEAKRLHAALSAAVEDIKGWNESLEHTRKFTRDQSLLMEDLNNAYDGYTESAKAAMAALQSGEIVKIANATREHEEAAQSLASAMDNLQQNLGDVTVSAEGWIKKLEEAEKGGKWVGDAVDTGKALSSAYKGIFKAAVEMQNAISSGSREKIVPAFEAYQKALAKLVPAEEQHKQALKDIAAQSKKASDDMMPLKDSVEATNKGLSLTSSKVAQFARSMLELKKIEEIKFPTIPNYNVQISSITTSQANQFVFAMGVLSKGLQGLAIPKLNNLSGFDIPKVNVNSANNFVAAVNKLSRGLQNVQIPKLATISRFTIPSLSVTRARNFVAAVKKISDGLKNIIWPKMPNLNPPPIPANVIQSWKDLRDVLKAINGVRINVPQPIKHLVKIDPVKLGGAGMASEDTLVRILNRIDSMRGVLWT